MRLAVLDANVLYPAHLRDVLLRLAAGGFFRPRWSARIHDEWTRNLLANRPDLTAEQLARTRELMEQAFPDAGVVGHEAHEASLALPDPDDRHVVAAAVEAEAGEIVTANLRDFPEAALRPLGIEAVSPDGFVASMLEDELAAVIAVMRRHREGLRRPPLTPEAYVDLLRAAGLSSAAEVLRGRVGEL